MRGGRPSSGFGAVGLLAAIAVLAGVAALTLGLSHGSSSGTHGHGAGAPVGTLGTSPGAAAGDISAAARATCQTDYQAVQQAADAYAAEHGHPPASVSDLSGILRDPVTSPYFTISIGPTGQVDVAAAGHVAASGAGNCAFA